MVSVKEITENTLAQILLNSLENKLNYFQDQGYNDTTYITLYP